MNHNSSDNPIWQTTRGRSLKRSRGQSPVSCTWSAVAGSGKTFLAVQLVIDTLKETAGQVLFIAPSLPLCFYFARWLGRRGSRDNISFQSLLDRLVILVPTMNFMKLVVQGRSLVSISDETLCNTEYDLTVVDEAHDIYKDDVLNSGFLDKVKTKRWLLLSNLSQSSVLTPKFPPNLKEVRLTQVVRSTKTRRCRCSCFSCNA